MSEGTAIRRSGRGKKRGIFRGLRSKMLIYFGSLFVLAIAALQWAEFYGVPFTAYGGKYRIWQSEVFKQLDLVADLKKDRLLRWIEERRDDTEVAAGNRVLGMHVAQLGAVIRGNMESGMEGEELWATVQREWIYQIPIQFLERIRTTYGVYKNIQIADAATGVIIVATQSTDLGMNVSEEDYFTEALGFGHSYTNIRRCSQTGRIELFISHVIKAVKAVDTSEDRPHAVLIMHINPGDFIAPMLHTGEGLGETGEALLVNREVRILTSLKHRLTDGTEAQPLEYQIQAKPATFAARGKEGIIATRDYRDVPVLAAYRHIHISPELGWGMVVKRDQAEVFGPLRQHVFYSFLMSLIVALAILALAYLVAVALSRPIRLLSHIAQRVESGDLDARVPIVKAISEEVNVLTGTFNSMIQRVQNWHEELDEQVRTRTAQLSELNKDLEREINERKRAEEQLRAALAEKEVLLREVHHRVKNNLQVLIYLIDMQVEAIGDPRILHAIGELQGRIRIMAIVHEKLYQSEDFAHVDFGDYLRELTGYLLSALGNHRDISLHVDAAELLINVDIAIPCGLIVNELMTNALKYAFPNPGASGCEINVAFGSRDGGYVLTISDNGVGLPAELDWRTTESLGLKLVNIWATYQLGGSIQMDTRNGTAFEIRFTERKRGEASNG